MSRLWSEYILMWDLYAAVLVIKVKISFIVLIIAMQGRRKLWMVDKPQESK